MPPATGERRAPAQPGRNSPHLQKSGLRGSFSLSAPESGARGAGVASCYGRVDVPGVDLSCPWHGTCEVPRALFRRFWPRPPRGRGGWRWGCVAVHRHARRGLAAGASPGWPRTRSRLLPGVRRSRPWPAEGGPAGGAVCSRGTAARGMCRGVGDGSTGTGKTWQRRGTGSPGMSRPAPGSPGSRRDCPELTRAASGRVAGAGTGTVRKSGQTVRPDSRTGAPSAPLANTGTNTYSV